MSYSYDDSEFEDIKIPRIQTGLEDLSGCNIINSQNDGNREVILFSKPVEGFDAVHMNASEVWGVAVKYETCEMPSVLYDFTKEVGDTLSAMEFVAEGCTEAVARNVFAQQFT